MMSGVWMYREGEARLFASPETVPASEGWVDSPDKVEANRKADHEHVISTDGQGDAPAATAGRARKPKRGG